MKNVFRHMLLILMIIMLVSSSSCFLPYPETTTENIQDENTEKQITIRLWHIWNTDIDANRTTLEAGLAMVQKAYPEINFEVDATENETYKTRIKTAMAVNDTPDIFFSWGGGFSEAFIDTDKVLCLDKYYTDEVQQALPRDFLQYQIYDGRIYGFPFMRCYAVMYANKNIFKENNLTIPDTYDELLETSRILSAKGITTMAVAGQEMWPLMFQYATLAMREVGPGVVRAALSGEDSFNQEGFIDAGYKLLELKEAGAFGEDCLSRALDPNVNAFKAGDGALYYHGSWATGGFTSDIPIANDIVACKYPGIGGAYDDTFLGGAVDCWMASAYTKYPDEVASVIIMLAEIISSIGEQTGMALPMWNSSIGVEILPGLSKDDYLQINKVHNDVVKLTEEVGADDSVLWWDTYLGKKGTRCNELIVEMFAGELSPEQFVVEMDGLIKQN